MITLPTDFCNPISQDIYDELLSTLQFHQLSCTCGLSGSLKVHGYYLRRLKNGPFSIMLRICRVKCSCCGRTHALLPDIIVPYSQISLPDQASIISSFEAGRSFQHVMERCPSIDENNLQRTKALSPILAPAPSGRVHLPAFLFGTARTLPGCLCQTIHAD